MRILVVDDSSPHRRLLTQLLGKAGHEVVTAPDGVAALALLEGQEVDAVVSDVKMPKMDGFQLCRTLRHDPRWTRLPFIFYSSVFIGNQAQELGMDLGATAYLDAKHVLPEQVGREIDAVVSRLVRAEYQEALVRVRDDVEFARRYHEVVLSALEASGPPVVRDTISSNARTLDDILTRLDSERRALTQRADVPVAVAELELLKELADYLGDKMNNPLAAILGSIDPRSTKASTDAREAAARVRTTVGRINDLVREIAKRGGHEFPKH